MAGEIELDRLPSIEKESKTAKFTLTNDRVQVFFKNNRWTVCVNAKNKQVTIIDPYGNQRVYPIEKLPNVHWKKYIVATKFVDLVKSKTPKITLYCNNQDYIRLDATGSKCTIVQAVLMENRDFEVSVKNENSDLIRRIKVDKSTFPESPNIFETKLELIYQQCLSIEKSLANVEKLSGISCFPATIGGSPAKRSGNDSMSAISVKSYSSKTASVPGIGIATQSPDGTIKLAFKDGSAISVMPNARIEYSSKKGVKKQFSKEETLPQPAMEKIQYIPRAIERLRSVPPSPT